MSNSDSIGFFDSGVGGLTIWKEVVKLLPMENTIYLADSLNAPYGEKSPEEVLDLCFRSVDFLISKGAKLIVVACNTATTQAIGKMRSTYSIPFIGIEPAVKPAALKSKTKCIGVLATNGTIESDHFNRTKEHYSNDVKVVTQVGEGLVRAIEDGEIGTVQLRTILSKHLQVLMSEPIDYIVLGCTHYPLLIPMIRDIVGDSIQLIDPGPSIALQTQRMLNGHGISNSNLSMGRHHLFSSGNVDVLESIVKNTLKVKASNISYSSLYQSE